MMNKFLRITAAAIIFPSVAYCAEKHFFHDTFNRPGSDNVSANIPMGQRGKLGGAGWTEHNQNGLKKLTSINGNKLILAKDGLTAAVTLNHNFIDPAIKAARGFSMMIDFDSLEEQSRSSTKTDNYLSSDPRNKYYGVGVGLAPNEILFKDQINFDTSFSIRGARTAMGAADFWIGFANKWAPELQIRSNGMTLENLPLTQVTGSLTLYFLLVDGFVKGDLVEVHAFLNGKRIDIDTTSDNDFRVFEWQGTDSNFIGLEARSDSGVKIDNVIIDPLKTSLKAITKSNRIIDPEANNPTTATGVFVFSPLLLLLFRNAKK